MDIERVAALEAVCTAAEALLRHFSQGYWNAVNRRGSSELREALTRFRDADREHTASLLEQFVENHCADAPPPDPPELDLRDRGTLLAINVAASKAAEQHALLRCWVQAYDDLARAADRLDAMEARRGKG